MWHKLETKERVFSQTISTASQQLLKQKVFETFLFETLYLWNNRLGDLSCRQVYMCETPLCVCVCVCVCVFVHGCDVSVEFVSLCVLLWWRKGIERGGPCDFATKWHQVAWEQKVFWCVHHHNLHSPYHFLFPKDDRISNLFPQHLAGSNTSLGV